MDDRRETPYGRLLRHVQYALDIPTVENGMYIVTAGEVIQGVLRTGLKEPNKPPFERRKSADLLTQQAARIAELERDAAENDAEIAMARLVIEQKKTLLTSCEAVLIAAQADSERMRAALTYLCDQIKRCNPIDNHGHNFRLNRAYCEAVTRLDRAALNPDKGAEMEKGRVALDD